MKGLNYFVVFFGLIFLNLSLNAQQSEYKIFYFSGSPKVVEKNTKQEVVRDSYISSKSVLQLPANSYVVLTNKAEVPMGISTAGDYSIADLNKIYQNVGNSNLTEEFFDYIANNMIQEDQKVRRSGGVYRAVGDMLKTPFDEAIFITDSIQFDWVNSSEKKLYLKIYDAETWEQPYNLATTDSSFTLAFDPEIFEVGKEYAWTVYHGEDHPQQGTILRVFTFADNEWKANFGTQLEEIQTGENTDMNHIKTIRLYLDNNVFPVVE
jgi:hypothetical protein